MAGAQLTATDLLDRLVGFDSTSARSNLPLIEFVADYLDGLGVPVRLIHDDGRVKADLYATIGPEEPGGFVLSGHTDVVPVTGQPWESDPFTLTAKDDKLYGRGATDMKGFIACVLAMAPAFRAAAPARPIHVALSYDEEVGCVGVRPMIDLIRNELPRPRLAIVGEPTEMRVVNAHKGISAQTTTVTGRDGHSSQPQTGVNAVVYAAEIIAFLDRLAADYAARPDDDPRFDPPGTTFNVGLVTGGTAVNIIARECRFHWEFRPAPGADTDEIHARFDAFVDEEILPRMRAVDPAAKVVTTIDVTAPSLQPAPDSPAEALALRLTGANRAAAASYVCEAGLFAGAGIPAIVCGPGSVAQAHQPDEFIARAQLDSCSGFLGRLLEAARG